MARERKINGVELTHDNLITATKLIQAECRSHKITCKGCPFEADAGEEGAVMCGIHKWSPEDWKIVNDKERIFKEIPTPIIY